MGGREPQESRDSWRQKPAGSLGLLPRVPPTLPGYLPILHVHHQSPGLTEARADQHCPIGPIELGHLNGVSAFVTPVQVATHPVHSQPVWVTKARPVQHLLGGTVRGKPEWNLPALWSLLLPPMKWSTAPAPGFVRKMADLKCPVPSPRLSDYHQGLQEHRHTPSAHRTTQRSGVRQGGSLCLHSVFREEEAKTGRVFVWLRDGAEAVLMGT